MRRFMGLVGVLVVLAAASAWAQELPPDDAPAEGMNTLTITGPGTPDWLPAKPSKEGEGAADKKPAADEIGGYLALTKPDGTPIEKKAPNDSKADKKSPDTPAADEKAAGAKSPEAMPSAGVTLLPPGQAEGVGAAPVALGDALIPTADLKPWGMMDELFTARGKGGSVESLLTVFAREGGRVPPAGLLMVAQLYAARGQMELAARYHYAAQLRARFDYARWPIKGSGNPYVLFTRAVQENTTSRAIGRWAAESSTRLGTVLADVQAWDAVTPYAYHPGFVIPTGDGIPPETEWPGLRQTARKAFFADGIKIVQALKSMGR